MDAIKRMVMEDAGWRHGTIAEFFGYTPDRMSRIERRARDCVAAGTSTNAQRFILGVIDDRRAEGIPDEGEGPRP